MKRIILAIIVALGVVACAPKESAIVDFTIENGQSKEIVVSKLMVNQLNIVDTVKVNKQGKGSFSVEMADQSPNFYYIVYKGKKLASLILTPGDRVSLSVDTLGRNLVINGSQESLLLKDVENQHLTVTSKLDSLAVELSNAEQNNNTEKYQALRVEMGRIYVKHKQAAIKNIVVNPYSFTNVNLLYQNVSENLPLFTEETDILYLMKIHDSISARYPKSIYIKALKSEITKFENAQAFAQRIAEAEETIFPEINLPDINSNKISLTSLLGKPFILVFWRSSDVNQKLFNKDLAEIYEKYHSRGLEIYQVSVDSDKAMWATAVKDQELKWINVCDGLAESSPAVVAYNIQSVPTLYLFNKEGSIVASNVFDKFQLDAEVAKTL